jgi:hypothetical protein
MGSFSVLVTCFFCWLLSGYENTKNQPIFKL